jgi:hypothetical protein
MNVVTNEVEGFIQVASEIGLTNLVVEPTRIIGLKLVGDGSHAVILPTRRTDDLLEEVLGDTENSYGHRSRLYNNNVHDDNTIQLTFRGKPGLVKALMTLGVDPKLLAAIKTAKMSEMKEFIDATTPKEIPENTEVAEIVLKLTSKSDRHTFKTKSSVLPEVTISMEVQGASPTYYLTGSAEKANTRYKLQALRQIEAATKMKGVAGTCSHQM